MITAILTSAIICFGVPQTCHPMLYGNDTPVGTFSTHRVITSDPGYGGDVLSFKETETDMFAIHRVWLLKPHQRRLERLKRDDVSQRKITGGCINVMPDVYESLIECCSGQPLQVLKSL